MPVTWAWQLSMFVGLFTCLDIKFASKFSEWHSVGMCFRNVVGLIEDLRRVVNSTKSASLFYFMIDSTSMDRSFSLSGVTGFRCPWKLTGALLGFVTAKEWWLFSQVAHLKCLWDFADRYRYSWGNKQHFLCSVNTLALCNSLWRLCFRASALKPLQTALKCSAKAGLPNYILQTKLGSNVLILEQ